MRLLRLVALAVLISSQWAAPATAITLVLSPTAVAAANELHLFQTEAAAQARCPRDEVVWLNTNTGIYHEKGMRWYGRTKRGVYVCRKEADAAGERDTRNGQ